ncbi:hypothetical protein [Rhodanobacter sp. MP1X3]|uniref:hypothetical protein n=1 Tax=Rhodanobacter sp. MP1X3 TaxID=2723086 RepID=UPI00160E760F|nr:hypothetical protein [Rhodanobacter sp. MP1X3]MBB6243782.1 hypothetical protein [Rhodanobacter sp. MP1X3]
MSCAIIPVGVDGHCLSTTGGGGGNAERQGRDRYDPTWRRTAGYKLALGSVQPG